MGAEGGCGAGHHAGPPSHPPWKVFANAKEAVTYLSCKLANLLKFELGCLSSVLLVLH